MDEFTRYRIGQETDNTKVKPVELLQQMISDIESGELNCDGLLLIAFHRPTDADWRIESYRCGLSRCEELALLDLEHERHIRHWRNI